MGRRPFYFFLLVFLAACGAGNNGVVNPHDGYRLVAPPKKDSNMFWTTDDDTEMNQAIARAKREFPRFDSAFMSGKYESDMCSIKLRFTTAKGHEYIWLTDLAKVNGRYRGVISDSPRSPMLFRQGDTVVANEADITDWMYGIDSVVHGAFTTRVIISRMTPAERKAEQLGFPYHLVD